MSEQTAQVNEAGKALDLNTLEVYLPHGIYPSSNLEYDWKRDNDRLVTPAHLARAYDNLVDMSVIPTDRKDKNFVFISLGSGIPTQEAFLFDYDCQQHPGNAIFRAVDNAKFKPEIIGALQRYDPAIHSEFFYLDEDAQDFQWNGKDSVDIFWIQKSILYFSLRGVKGMKQPKDLLDSYFEQLGPHGAIVVDYHDSSRGVVDKRLPTSTGRLLLDSLDSLGINERQTQTIGEGSGRMLVLQKKLSL